MKARRQQHFDRQSGAVRCRCNERGYTPHGRPKVVFCKYHRAYVRHGVRDRKTKISRSRTMVRKVPMVPTKGALVAKAGQ